MKRRALVGIGSNRRLNDMGFVRFTGSAARLIGVSLVAALVAGCNANGFTARSDLSALRPGASTIAIVDTIAPDPAISKRFGEALAREAQARGYTVVPAGAGQSALQVKAWLDAFPVDATRSAYAYVLQTSPDGRSRGERVNGASTVNLPLANAWTSLDDNLMRQLARQSLDDLTRTLAGDAPAPQSAPAEE
jgi:hypothetical protein